MIAIVTDAPAARVLYPASILGGLLLWEWATSGVSRILVAPPSAVLLRLYQGFASGALGEAFLNSLGHLALGYAIAFAIALPLGTLMGRVASVRHVLDPAISAIYAIPPVALIPFLIIWFGLFFEARVALVVLMCVFEMLVTFAAGARNAPPTLIEVGRAFGASRWRIARAVIFPSMLPFVFTGLRLGMVRAIHAMIVAELFLAAVNLGAYMKRASVRFDSAGVLAVIVLLAVFGLAVQEGFKFAERKLLSWRNVG